MLHPSDFCSPAPTLHQVTLGRYGMLQHLGSIPPPLPLQLRGTQSPGTEAGEAPDFSALPCRSRYCLRPLFSFSADVKLPYLLESGAQTQHLSRHRLFDGMPVNTIWPEAGNRADGRETRVTGLGDLWLRSLSSGMKA